MTTADLPLRRADAPPHPAVAAIAEQVRGAHAAGAALRIVGGGAWLDAGEPVDAPAHLETRATAGITEYVPGDLTLTALAGTSLAALHDATHANGQRLTLDPYGTDAGTLGATVATASAGPSAAAFGTPRDIVLGLTMVTGTGDIVTAGGRVVKNVAGFDLVRLATGAWGTVGVIAEVSVRLRARPPREETFAVPVDADDDRQVTAAASALRALPFTFDALELLDGATASALGLSDAPHGALLARAADRPEIVLAMRAALGVAGQAMDADPSLWARLRGLEPAGSATLRLSHAPARVADVWRAARDLARSAGGWAHLAVGRAVARVTLPRRPDESAAAFDARITGALRIALAGAEVTCIGERLPAGAWAVLPRRHLTDPVLARLSRGVREAFDAARLLNPGIRGVTAGDS